MKSHRIFLSTAVVIIALLTACGEGVVDLDEGSYEQRIVIEGTIFPGQPVTNIRLTRNFPLNIPSINKDAIIITDAQATITDETGTVYDLVFNSESGRYEYPLPDLQIEHGKSYTLEVNATIDGRALTASSTTTVPLPGFRVLESESVLDSMRYRERDENGEVRDFRVAFERSPGTDFYAVSVTALNADTSTFIYDNPFCDCNVEDVMQDFDEFRSNYNWIQDTDPGPGQSSIEIFSFFTWFYGDYRAVVYAGDKNFKDFLVTYEEVQEIDGNFHEPAFHIEGDGIGVFGSAIADTAYFRILRD